MMERSFKLQAYSDDLVLLAEYSLANVTSPSGLGFKQKLGIISTRTMDYIATQQIQKDDIKLTVNFIDPGSYAQANAFRSWIGRYIKKKNVIYYNDGNVERWGDVAIKEFGVTEVNAGVNSIPIVLQPLSPWYQLESKLFIVTVSIAGKEYPYPYPYTYGGGTLVNADFTNSFFDAIPLKIRIQGKVVNPQVSLKLRTAADPSGTIYTTVSFPGFTLDEGQFLEIDAIGSRILFYASATATPVDYYNHVDKTKDTFIYAEPGDNTIVANLSQLEPNAKVIVTYVQYQV